VRGQTQDKLAKLVRVNVNIAPVGKRGALALQHCNIAPVGKRGVLARRHRTPTKH
jgi:hypothetical protein